MVIGKIKRLSLRAGFVAVSMSLVGQPAVAYFNHGGSGIKTLWVNCANRTIGNALKRHPTKALVIIVKGICHEDVVIDRNRVTLVAATPQVDGITSQAADGAAVTVSGAQSIVIDGLRLQSAGRGFPTGLFVTRNGEATIQNALIDNNAYGIWANHGGFFLVRDSDVVNNSNYGIFLTDGANARVQASTIEGNSAALAAFRGINLRLRGDNVIGNEAGDGFSLDLFHSVEFRQDGGHTIFNGPMEFGNLTNASLRNPEIKGASSIDVLSGSHVDIRKSNTGPNELTGGGDITVSGNSQLNLRSGIAADVGSINVGRFASLVLGDNVSVTTTGEVLMDRSELSMAPGSSMNVGGNFTAVDGADVRIFGDDASLNVAGDFSANDRADISIFGNGASLNVVNDFGAVNRVDIFIPGDGANLNVGGNFAADRFFTMSLGHNVSLNFGFMGMSTFAVLSGGNNVSITGDVDFGPNVGNVFFEDDVSYAGIMSFGEPSDLTFGSGAKITGTIDCNGGIVHVATKPIFTLGNDFDNCVVELLP